MLEVDGRPWRTVPADVVVRAGLAPGLELDRPALRRVRRELARARALDVAGRALAQGDVSSRRLEERLRRADVAQPVAASVLAGLRRAGVADDARAARARAEVLAARGWGDEAVAARLEADGFDEMDVRGALAALDPELPRARALVGREPDARRAARLLARRGFADETAESLLGGLD
ncbi:MAG TPA: RecX family transcriptional regulator [Gaiellaceae bacterium]|nr:RecX family transcriptional regulator [Gaiellaceae bacterium]